MFYVYILYSPTYNKYYKGQTNDIESRLKRHNNGSEKYTRGGLPWELVCVLKKETRSEAMVLEAKLKNLNKIKIEAFIKKYGISN